MCSSGHGYIEYGRYKNGKTVQPDARLENTAGNAGSSKYLFIYLTKAEPNSLNRSYHPHLPRFGGKKEIIEKISQIIITERPLLKALPAAPVKDQALNCVMNAVEPTIHHSIFPPPLK